jgi:hypothetical protein
MLILILVLVIIAFLILGLGADVMISSGKGSAESRRIALLCAPLEVQKAEAARVKRQRTTKLIALAVLIAIFCGPVIIHLPEMLQAQARAQAQAQTQEHAQAVNAAKAQYDAEMARLNASPTATPETNR